MYSVRKLSLRKPVLCVILASVIAVMSVTTSVVHAEDNEGTATPIAQSKTKAITGVAVMPGAANTSILQRADMSIQADMSPVGSVSHMAVEIAHADISTDSDLDNEVVTETPEVLQTSLSNHISTTSSELDVRVPSGITAAEFDAVLLHEQVGHGQYFEQLEQEGYSGLFFAAVEAVESGHGRHTLGAYNTLNWTPNTKSYNSFEDFDDMWDYTVERFDEYFCNPSEVRFTGYSVWDINKLYAFWHIGDTAPEAGKYSGYPCSTCQTYLAQGIITQKDLGKDSCINWYWGQEVTEMMDKIQGRVLEFRSSELW